MRRLVTAAEMRAIERASAEQGVSTVALMEKAGTALATEALRLAAVGGRFVVLCGRGNNGGDGVVAARVLRAAGREVLCELLPGDDAKLPVEARNALATAGFTPAPVPPAFSARRGDVIIDALLGTGVSRAPEGAYAEAMHRIAAWRADGAKVLAADLPSGLNADTGMPFEPCVAANATVTFGYSKVGLCVEPGASRAGQVTVAEIGLPPAADLEPRGTARAYRPSERDVLALLPPRTTDSHKGTYGHVLVLAGSAGKTGAAALAARGALRGGAGLVTVAATSEVLPAIQAFAPEMMGAAVGGDDPLGVGDLHALLAAAQGKDALVVGPGIARGPQTGALLGELFRQVSTPCVVDADGLNALAEDLRVLEGAEAPLVLTPHPGEMARLLGVGTKEVQRDRVGAARKLAAERRCVVVLKGAGTVIAAPDGTVYVNPTGNPGMATGGSGDVLAGLCGALLAQGLSPVDAAIVAVYAHGLAGDLMARRRGQLGLIASDLVDGLGEVWAKWGR